MGGRKDNRTMCLAVPMQIVEIQGASGIAEVSGVRRQVSLALLAGVKLHDWVLIHAGFAISKVNRSEAQKSLALFRAGGYID